MAYGRFFSRPRAIRMDLDEGTVHGDGLALHAEDLRVWQLDSAIRCVGDFHVRSISYKMAVSVNTT